MYVVFLSLAIHLFLFIHSFFIVTGSTAGSPEEGVVEGYDGMGGIEGYYEEGVEDTGCIDELLDGNEEDVDGDGLPDVCDDDNDNDGKK